MTESVWTTMIYDIYYKDILICISCRNIVSYILINSMYVYYEGTVGTKSLWTNIFLIKRKRVDTVLYFLFLIFN